MIKVFRISMCILLIIWMGIIFSFSSQNAGKSSVTSGRVANVIAQIVVKNFDKMNDIDKQSVISSLQFITRKSAHVSVYFVLGVISLMTLITYNGIPLKIRIMLSSMICLLYSISDEVHQLFVNGRSGQISDVILDFSSSIVAIGLCIIFYILYKRKKSKLQDGDII